MEKKRIVSGMRPTGDIHIGNYFGALANWVRLQDAYDCHYFIADWHALTTGYAETGHQVENIYHLTADYLACGLDLEKCNLFLQSKVKQHAELHLLLSMVTPLSWLERVPTYKAQLEQLAAKNITTYGFLGYPTLMTADIILYCAHYVPVGEDQLSHLELSRELVRRFNYIYQKEVFPEPLPLLTEAKLLPGTDGRKMSKSYGNTISLGETPESVRKKVMGMVTDPARIHKTDPGHPDICTAFAYHRLFSEPAETEIIESSCKAGEIGCVACKRELYEKIAAWHQPIYERRTDWLTNRRSELREILLAGSARAEQLAEETMCAVRGAMQIGF